MDNYFNFYFSFAKEFGRLDWEGYGSFIHQWTKRYGIVNKAICGSKESATPHDELETWKETVLVSPLPGTHQMTFTLSQVQSEVSKVRKIIKVGIVNEFHTYIHVLNIGTQ